MTTRDHNLTTPDHKIADLTTLDHKFYDLTTLDYQIERPIMVLEIPGHPVTKKNHSQIVRRGKFAKLLPSKQYLAYSEVAIEYLKLTYHRPVLTEDLNLTVKYYLKNNTRPDLINLLQATQDILEAAGIIENDRQFKGLNGSNIVGLDKENPRALIFLSPYRVPEATTIDLNKGKTLLLPCCN